MVNLVVILNAKLCIKCNVWLEGACGDPYCEYCAERPLNPRDKAKVHIKGIRMKEVMDSSVGVFYVINDKLFVDKERIRNATRYGSNITYSGGHDTFYNDELIKMEPCKYVDYDYFPRGRVVYDYKKVVFKVFLDVCIDNSQVIKAVIEEFKIKGSVICLRDSHYVCNICNEEYVKL